MVTPISLDAVRACRNASDPEPSPESALTSVPIPAEDQLQWIEQALLSLHDLYASNAQLTEDLRRTSDEAAAAKAEVAKWQDLATTAVAAGKDLRAERSVLEDRLFAAEQHAAASRQELADYKNKFSGSVEKLRQVHDRFSSQGRTVHVAGHHFRSVSAGAGK